MPDRIRKYLNETDKLRDQTDEAINKMLAEFDLEKLVSNPKEYLKIQVLLFIKNNVSIFKEAQKNGQNLVKLLKKVEQ